MSRNIDKTNELIFDLIKLKFDLSGPLPAEFNESRFIAGNISDKNWLIHSKIKDWVELSPESYFGFIEYGGLDYFFTTGISDPIKLPVGFTAIDVNAGIFAALVAELELPVLASVSNLNLENNILSQHVGEQLYTGHRANQLKHIFPNIFIAELSLVLTYDSTNIYQIICDFLSSNKQFINLPFSTKTLDEINNLVVINSKILSYESIAQALLSSNYKFAFLDLYRCTEMLYQIIYIDEAHTKLGLTGNKIDFLTAIDEQLNWKPNERNSIRKLFSSTPPAFNENLHKTIKQISGLRSLEKHSDWLYDLRCNIVHLKSIQSNYNIKPNEWDELLYGMSVFLSYWYSRYLTF